MTDPTPGPVSPWPPMSPSPSCPLGWQPHALAPVFYGARSLGPADGAPVPLRIFFPSLDGAVESAPILEHCGRYPVVLFAHGHCPGDADHYRRWFRIPAQLARAGNVVVVPHLQNISTGNNPSGSTHDIATVESVLSWVRSGWEHAEQVLAPPATGIVGHSYGAMLGARFALSHPVSAYAGLSGEWLHDWVAGPVPLPSLDVPNLLAWGDGPSDKQAPIPDSLWQSMVRPRHRVVFAEGEHWDYLGANVSVPCGSPGPCPHIAGAMADLLTMFFGRYLPPELAIHLPEAVPPTLKPPALNLTAEQEFFAGGYLGGFDALGTAPCECTIDGAVPSLVVNTRSKETHSLDRPCAWTSLIATRHRRVVSARPVGYKWCDFCFRSRADG